VVVVGVFNYLCNRCISPLISWVRISNRPRCTTLCDKVCLRLAAGRSVVFSRCSGFLHQ
jgi:hypothetical protein